MTALMAEMVCRDEIPLRQDPIGLVLVLAIPVVIIAALIIDARRKW